MKTRLFLTTLCIFMLPVCFGYSNGASSQFSVYAGHWVRLGAVEYCECNSSLSECTCGETLTVEPTEPATPASSSRAPVDVSSEALLVVAVVMLFLRFRAIS